MSLNPSKLSPNSPLLRRFWTAVEDWSVAVIPADAEVADFFGLTLLEYSVFGSAIAAVKGPVITSGSPAYIPKLYRPEYFSEKLLNSGWRVAADDSLDRIVNDRHRSNCLYGRERNRMGPRQLAGAIEDSKNYQYLPTRHFEKFDRNLIVYAHHDAENCQISVYAGREPDGNGEVTVSLHFNAKFFDIAKAVVRSAVFLHAFPQNFCGSEFYSRGSYSDGGRDGNSFGHECEILSDGEVDSCQSGGLVVSPVFISSYAYSRLL